MSEDDGTGRLDLIGSSPFTNSVLAWTNDTNWSLSPGGSPSAPPPGGAGKKTEARTAAVEAVFLSERSPVLHSLDVWVVKEQTKSTPHTAPRPSGPRPVNGFGLWLPDVLTERAVSW